MTTTKKSPAKKKFCVWADYVRRVYQHVTADTPKQAHDLAKKRVECWDACDWHDNNGYRLSNEVQDLATEEFIAVHGKKHCRTCGSEIVRTINDSNFCDGECGACEYQRYTSQPALMKECETELENWRMLRDDEWNGSQEGTTDAMEGLQNVLHQAHGLNK
jgi:hypothetical protein